MVKACKISLFLAALCISGVFVLAPAKAAVTSDEREMAVSNSRVDIAIMGSQSNAKATTIKRSGNSIVNLTVTLNAYERKVGAPGIVQTLSASQYGTTSASAIKNSDSGYVFTQHNQHIE